MMDKELMKCKDDALFGKLDNKDQSSFLKYSIEEIPLLSREKVKDAMTERFVYCMVRSKTYMILSPIFFRFMGDMVLKTLFIEVRMKSRRSYTSYDFLLEEKVKDYLKKVEFQYTSSDESIMCKEIIELVNQAILRKNRRFQIEKVYVVVRE